MFHYLVIPNNILQTTYNPIADQYPKDGNPNIPVMTAFHINISIKGNTRRNITAPRTAIIIVSDNDFVLVRIFFKIIN
jgi:hypothetical protein